jgi:hypothetical protein
MGYNTSFQCLLEDLLIIHVILYSLLLQHAEVTGVKITVSDIKTGTGITQSL